LKSFAPDFGRQRHGGFNSGEFERVVAGCLFIVGGQPAF